MAWIPANDMQEWQYFILVSLIPHIRNLNDWPGFGPGGYGGFSDLAAV